jgi:PAS domain S-box-containing protein
MHGSFARQIIDAVPAVIYVFDIHQRKYLFINREIIEALGYDPGPAAHESDFIRSLMHADDWPLFLEYIGRLSKLGDSASADFEYRIRHNSGAWHWFHTRDRVFTRNEDGSVREIVGTATDITKRKSAEQKTRFIADLNQALLPLGDPEQIMNVAVRMLGEYLGVDRCGYAEVQADEDHFVVMGDYARGDARSIVGRYRMSDFGDREREVLLKNWPYVVNDIVAESPAGTDLSLYELGNIRSLVCVPLNKSGNFVARMAVQQSTPRAWTAEEIELVTLVANRCWEAVERARALRRLKDSDERYRAFIANSSEAIWRFELEQPIRVSLPEDEQVEMLFKFAYLAECNDAMARMYGYDSADQILGARLADLLLRSHPENIAGLRALRQAGYRMTDVETRERDRDGNIKYFLNNLNVIEENGAIIRGWGTQRDITGQKRAQEALRASEERLRRITEATQDALWEIDLNTNGLWWSEGAKLLFGHGPGELQIHLEDWYRRIHPDDIERVRTRFEKFMWGDDTHWSDKYRFRRPEGSYIYIYDRGRKFIDQSGGLARIAGAMVDITERETAEEALRESEERYRLLTELSPDGVVIAAADGNIHLTNPSMLRMLGSRQEEVIGHSLFEFIAPEFLNHCSDCMKTVMTDGAPATPHVDAEFRTGDGSKFPVEVGAVRFEWKGRQFAQIVIHDISWRKQAEAERQRWSKEIEAERDRLRRILEQMPIGVAISAAPSGRMLFHNVEGVRLLGHSLLPIENYRTYARYGGLHEDGTPLRTEEYPGARSLLTAEVIKGEEMRYLRPDGTETFLSVDSAPIYDPEGGMALVVLTFIDITERKRAEKALRESEERFAKAFRASPDCLVISRISDAVVIEVNDSFLALSGYAREEIVGKSTVMLGLYADPEVRRRALAILKEENHVRDFEFAMKQKSGELRMMTFSAEPLELRGEQCWLTIGRDITERKQAEQARERFLMQEKAAREEAETANRMKDEFLATISHELRTPLTSILGWAHILAEGLIPESQKRHALEVIERSARSQKELIDNILDTSRIITGRLKLDAHPVEIDQVFQAAADVIRPSAEAKHIDLQAVVDDWGLMVFGDANRLQQVIWNVLSNAVKFTHDGGRVEAHLSSSGSHVEISVRDNGMGIDSKFLPYVFERFRQADSTSTRKYSGLGLGLAIVRHLVEMHGGSVSASSPGEGLGSTFKIQFPLVSPLRQSQAQSSLENSDVKGPNEATRPETFRKLDGVRVLVVEDDPDTLDMLRFVLNQCGANVMAAASTREALEVMEHWQPALLVSDLAMPDRDGYELIAQIRSRGPERGGDIPAVALTAYARAEDRVRALAAGFQMHVPKPVDTEELITVVASLTGHIRL